MTTQFLRDEKGRTIGTIASTANGVLVLRNAKGQSLGTYDPQRNVTIDSKPHFRVNGTVDDDSQIRTPFAFEGVGVESGTNVTRLVGLDRV